MKTSDMKDPACVMRMMICGTSALLACVACAAVRERTVEVPIDLKGAPVKDLRASRSAPDLGYAGSVTSFDSPYFEEFFVKNPERTWEVMREGGARTLKEWAANERWEIGMAYAACKTDTERKAFEEIYRQKYRNMWGHPLPMPGDPKIAFDFRKKHKIPVLLCIEQYYTFTNVWEHQRTPDLAAVKKSILAFVQWIVDNGYRDQVVGFELGNEPFFECEGGSPEKHAKRWGEIIPEIKRIFPECDIGIPVAEYRSGDPDIAQVRKRSTAVDAWFKDNKEFGFQNLNQWSGRFIVAFSNRLDLCSHLVYHFYGGNPAYGCGVSGFNRIRNFAKVFPEIADKRIWITEWRERSDEDRRCHLMHASTLFKAHYTIACLCQPNIDGIYLHSCESIAGGFNTTDGQGTWWFQTDEKGRLYPAPKGPPRIEVGPCGPLFKLYNETLMKYPLVLLHGALTSYGNGPKADYWGANEFYEFSVRLGGWQRAGSPAGKRPKCTGYFEWAAVTNPERNTLAILAVNTREELWKPTFVVNGKKLSGTGTMRYIKSQADKICLHQVPGEPRTFTVGECEVRADALALEPYLIAVCEFPL